MLMKLCAATLMSAPLLEVKKLDTPLPCYVAEDEKSDVITMTFAFKTSGDIGQERKGILDVLTLMLKEGAGNMDQKEFKKYLLDHAIETSFSSTCDHLTLTFRVSKEKIDNLFYCVRSLFENPHFSREDLDKVKEQVVSDLSQATHMPDTKAKEAFNDFVLKDHPYTQKIEDQIHSIKKLTPEDLKRAWTRSITRERLVVAVSGGMSKVLENKLKDFLKKLNLPNLGENSSLVHFEKTYSMHNLGKEHHVKEDIPQTVILFALPSLDRNHPDFYALNFAIYAFASGYFETRLMTEIREKRGLAYGCGAGVRSDLLLKMIIGKTATNTKNVKEVIKIIKSELKKLVEKGLTKKEFDFHQAYLVGKAPLRLSDTYSINAQIISAACYDLDPQEHINNSRAKYQNLTLETVNQVIKKHIKPEQLVIVSMGRS